MTCGRFLRGCLSRFRDAGWTPVQPAFSFPILVSPTAGSD